MTTINSRSNGTGCPDCALGSKFDRGTFEKLLRGVLDETDRLNDAQLLTLLEVSGALNSRSQAKVEMLRRLSNARRNRTTGGSSEGTTRYTRHF